MRGQRQRVLREEAGAFRVDAAHPERLHQRVAHAVVVRLVEVLGDGDEGAQEIAEGHIDGRAIVERAGAEAEEELGGIGGVSGQQPGERPGQVGGPLGAAGAVDPEQIVGATHIDAEERVEHGGDQDRAAEVRIVDVGVDVVGVGRDAEGGAQAPFAAARLAELHRELDQRIGLAHLGDDFGRLVGRRSPAGNGRHRRKIGLIEAPAGALDRVDQGVLLGEMREQRAQVREALVEGQHVGIGGLREVGADAVDDRVGHLVRDDVLRQAGEDALAGKVAALAALVGGEEAEQDAVRLRAVIGVGLPASRADRA